MAAKVFKFWPLFVLCLLAAGAAFYWTRPAPGIAVVHPVRGPAVQAVYATGTVEADVMLPLAARVTARLTELLADEGDKVQKGQALARLEDEDLRKNLAELKARAELAQKEYERKKALVTRNIGSKQAADQALAERDAANAAVEREQALLGFLTLSAPDNGRIIRRDGEIGELIPANQPIFWLSCCGGLRIEAEVDEEDIALVAPGQKVVIRADAFPDKVFSGTVSSITPKGDPVSRSYRVRIALGPDTGLMIGMTAETNIIIRKDEDAILVPVAALTEDDKVLKVIHGKIAPVDVQIGARTPEIAEIRSGLGVDDLIVQDGAQAVQAGQAVKTSLKKWEAP